MRIGFCSNLQLLILTYNPSFIQHTGLQHINERITAGNQRDVVESGIAIWCPENSVEKAGHGFRRLPRRVKKGRISAMSTCGNREESNERHLDYYRQMLTIRLFEEKVLELLMHGVIDGGSHLYVGEEAVAVGACSVLRKDDYLTSTHRGHGHCIARGTGLKEMMAELLGKQTGCCKGKGGSLHIADFSLGNLGANGIVGGSIPIATGAGLSIIIRGTDQVVLCFFGDGAVNQGCSHESLNAAAIWNLPVVYVCENNLYGMSVPVKKAFPFEDLVVRAKAYGIPGEIVDGMNVLEVRHAVQHGVNRARQGGGPSFLECKTYRYHGHSRGDPRVYRTKEEEETWKKRDPIATFKGWLLEQGATTIECISAIEHEVAKEIDEAVEFALDSPWPKVTELYEDLFYDNENAPRPVEA